MITKYKYKIIATVLLVLFLCGCSTSKDKWANRTYHNVVAHYNALWNGENALKDAQRTVEKSWKDDYTRILPVFINGTEEQAKGIKANTDRAIEKGSKVTKKHSMRFSGVEKNPQIDDAYLLIGKSCYYAHDYKGAEATFQYIIANWKDSKEMYEPMLWLALTYSKERKFNEAEIVLKQVKKAIEDKKAPKKLNNFLNLISAENNIAQGKTLPALENFALRKKNPFQRRLNTRIRFIEGQIYMNNKQYNQATKAFKYTSRHASDYSMQFVSKLNIALCYDPLKKNSVSIVEDLEDMLDDKKNDDFQDQIYYAIGEIYFRNRNMDIACKKWEESVKASKTNKIQKMASALRAANVYYDTLHNYKKAQMYYDTALSIMSRDYPNRDVIVSRHKVLTSLVDNLNTVERWDSLLAMSEMPEAELNAKIKEWIDAYKLEQKKKEEEEKLQKALMARNASLNNFNQLNNQNRSNFYFNNPSTVQSGSIEFKRRWGDRALEDNWRLNDKNEIGFVDEDVADNEQEDSEEDTKTKSSKTQLMPDNPDYYKKDIPFTQSAKDSANEDIAKALMDAGYIYYQGLNDKPKAVETFLDLHKRYPTHRNILPSSYHLYKIYDSLGNYPSSNFYKNKVLTEYPESEYAMMIKYPDYWDDIKNNNTFAERLYKETYNRYSNNEYLSAIESSQQAIDSIKNGPYIPRLLYLSALSKGRLYGVDSLADNLNMIIFNYPESEVTPTIEKQLIFLAENYDIKDFDIKYDPNAKKKEEENKEQIPDGKEENLTQEQAVNRDDILDAEALMFRNKDMQHYYIILADDSKIDISYLQEVIDDFNKENYADNDLKSTAQLFTSSQQMVNVRKFKNKEEALDYYDSIQKDKKFSSLNSTFYKHFVISVQNYATFYNRRNIEAYVKFFRLMYLKDREDEQADKKQST